MENEHACIVTFYLPPLQRDASQSLRFYWLITRLSLSSYWSSRPCDHCSWNPCYMKHIEPATFNMYREHAQHTYRLLLVFLKQMASFSLIPLAVRPLVMLDIHVHVLQSSRQYPMVKWENLFVLKTRGNMGEIFIFRQRAENWLRIVKNYLYFPSPSCKMDQNRHKIHP